MGRSFQNITYSEGVVDGAVIDGYRAIANSGRWRVFVFLGTPPNKLLYRRLLATAPADRDMIVVNRLGFGKGHREAYTSFDDQLTVLKPFLPGGEFGDRPIITVGVSYGGCLALKAAIDYPDTVKGVVSVAALVKEPHGYALALEKAARSRMLEPITPNRLKKVRAEVAGRRAQIGPLFDQLKDLEAPVEILHGDFDGIVPRSNAEDLMDLLGERAAPETVEIIPGGGHYLELQYPRRIHKAIGRIITRVEARDGGETR